MLRSDASFGRINTFGKSTSWMLQKDDLSYQSLGKNRSESSEEDESDESDDEDSSDASEEIKVSNFIESTRQIYQQPVHQEYNQVILHFRSFFTQI